MTHKAVRATDIVRTHDFLIVAQKLTDSIVETLPIPARGNRIACDTDVKGFGVRVTAAGARAFVLNYRTRAGRERRFTIGAFPDWRVAAARHEAAELKKRIDRGEDPLGEIQDARDAKTMSDLCERFRAEHFPKKRPSTQLEYGGIIEKYILPELQYRKVAEVTFANVDNMHRLISKHALTERTVPSRCWRRCLLSQSSGGGGPTIPSKESNATKRRNGNAICQGSNWRASQ